MSLLLHCVCLQAVTEAYDFLTNPNGEEAVCGQAACSVVA